MVLLHTPPDILGILLICMFTSGWVRPELLGDMKSIYLKYILHLPQQKMFIAGQGEAMYLFVCRGVQSIPERGSAGTARFLYSLSEC